MSTKILALTYICVPMYSHAVIHIYLSSVYLDRYTCTVYVAYIYAYICIHTYTHVYICNHIHTVQSNSLMYGLCNQSA